MVEELEICCSRSLLQEYLRRKIMSGFNMQRFNATGLAFEIDPVCEMKVDPQNPPFKIVFRDKTYYFCSEICKHLFERMPEKYIKTGET